MTEPTRMPAPKPQHTPRPKMYIRLRINSDGKVTFLCEDAQGDYFALDPEYIGAVLNAEEGTDEIASITVAGPEIEFEAAKPLIRAVNAHDELVEALRALYDFVLANHGPAYTSETNEAAWDDDVAAIAKQARTLLAKVEGR